MIKHGTFCINLSIGKILAGAQPILTSLHVKANKKNICVSGSPTDPKNSGPTLNFFSQKNPIFRITNLPEN